MERQIKNTKIRKIFLITRKICVIVINGLFCERRIYCEGKIIS